MIRGSLFKVLVYLVFTADIVSAAVQADQSIRVTVDPASQYASRNVLVNDVGLPFLPALVTPEGIGRELSSFMPAAANAGHVPGNFRPPTFSRPISKIKAPQCYVPSWAPLPCCILLIRSCGQWELSAQVFFARVKGTVYWPATVRGVPSTDISLNDDLGIPEHETLLEYSATYQLPPRWALFYSVMTEETGGGPELRLDSSFDGQFTKVVLMF